MKKLDFDAAFPFDPIENDIFPSIETRPTNVTDPKFMDDFLRALKTGDYTKAQKMYKKVAKSMKKAEKRCDKLYDVVCTMNYLIDHYTKKAKRRKAEFDKFDQFFK